MNITIYRINYWQWETQELQKGKLIGHHIAAKRIKRRPHHYTISVMLGLIVVDEWIEFTGHRDPAKMLKKLYLEYTIC